MSRYHYRKRGYNLRTRYGIDEVTYYAKWDAQNGRCAICGTSECQPLHVDHDHESGKVRGLLCSKCNTGIGHLGDNPAITEIATEYLKFYGQSTDSAEGVYTRPIEGDVDLRRDQVGAAVRSVVCEAGTKAGPAV